MKRAVLGMVLSLIMAIAGTLYLTSQHTSPVVAMDEISDASDEAYERLFDDSLHHEIHITLEPAEWRGMATDMLHYSVVDERMRTGNYRVAAVEYRDEHGSYFIQNTGIRTKGNTTRKVPEDLYSGMIRRSHFKLKFDAFSSQTFLGQKELVLKASTKDDPSFVHEKFAYDLLRAEGVPAPRMSHAVVTFHIGDRVLDYGVYGVIEAVDKRFLTRTFGSQLNDGNLYKCLWQDFGPASLEPIVNRFAIGIKDWKENYRPAYDLVTNTKTVEHKDLLVFVDALNRLEGEAFEAFVEESIDVEVLLKAFAVTVLVGSPDDYRAMGNNYYLYFRPDGKMVFMPFDFDNSLGYGWDGAHYGGYEGIANADIYNIPSIDSVLSGKKVTHPLADKILAIPKYREAYETYLLELIESGQFGFERFSALFEATRSLYLEDFENVTYSGNESYLINEPWFIPMKIESVIKQIEEKRSKQ